MSEHVRVEVDGGIGTIRLDRPPMNALNIEIQDAIRAASTECAERDDIRAVIVYGGEKVFAAGADIKEMEEMSYAEMVDRSVALSTFLHDLANLPKPTMAAIAGYALGGGCELALACDFRIASAGARLGQPEILLGIIPGAGGTQRLSRLVGPARAKDLVFTGRFVGADEAFAMGLIDEIVPEGDDVHARAVEKLTPFVTGPSYALRAAKEAINRGLETDLDTGLDIERIQFAGLFATKDRSIGMRSFVENGPGKAQFEGR